ncbi:ORF255 [White spot syndrome virus]|uniref:ORF255 n=1 Tax=White spot syndrome virus TaxID=342409 RepID=A0A2D3I6P4_9VIRU|nr:ORF255 [White spot syndrome virus]
MGEFVDNIFSPNLAKVELFLAPCAVTGCRIIPPISLNLALFGSLYIDLVLMGRPDLSFPSPFKLGKK